MEESYMVHRRRKAAARKREKTPDPSSRGTSRVDSSDDEDEDMRAKMEKMAEEAEKMEQQKENEITEEKLKKPADKDKKKYDIEKFRGEKEKRNVRNSLNMDDIIIHAEVAAKIAGNDLRIHETDVADNNNTQPIKRIVEVINKPDDGTPKRDITKAEIAVKEKIVQETSAASKETITDTVKPPEIRKIERQKIKRKSKERVERQSFTTDSSDVDEKTELNKRRTKSPETVRLRTKRSVKSRAIDQLEKNKIDKFNREEISPSRQELEDAQHLVKINLEKSQSRPYGQIEDIDENKRITKKSESSPQKSTEKRETVKKYATDIKKQIIPLSNESLIEDFQRIQREYLSKECSILDPDSVDMFQDTVETNSLRRRTLNLAYTESEHEEIINDTTQSCTTDVKKVSWFSWLFFWYKKKQHKEIVEEKIDNKLEPIVKVEETRQVKQEFSSEKVTILDFFRALKDIVSEFKAFMDQNPQEIMRIRRLRNLCMAELLLVIIYCGLGAFVFRFVEGAFENFYKCGVKRVKRDFLDSLWNYSHNLKEDDWKSMARRKLMEFEDQLHTAHEAGVHTYSGQKSWSFLNAAGYCLSVITTIGYGHISPSTNTGRAITIIYAIFGIPMFLIILADFGKLFTRGIKFLWAFVRRLYYTGSCRKVRRTAPVQEVMKGVQLVYDLAKFRRPSQMNPEEIEEMQKHTQQSPTVVNLDTSAPDTPGTPAMSAFAIDDEFNLPISVAIFILLGYIFVGATLYYMWEDWGFFESFYFVFISMSTIGFGDYVPEHPIYMMCSIVYLVFGLALTSMCINVVQVMLSDSFKQASQKIGATIGFEIAEDDSSVKPAAPPSIEVPDIHISTKKSEREECGEKIAPKAKQEDVDL